MFVFVVKQPSRVKADERLTVNSGRTVEPAKATMKFKREKENIDISTI